jgi:hypothetical protein
MRVDQHLIRAMLEVIEASPRPEIMLMPVLHSDLAVQRHHLQLLIDGGYVTAQQLRRYGRPCALGLTLAGQELLGRLRGGTGAKLRDLAERVLTGAAAGLVAGQVGAVGF